METVTIPKEEYDLLIEKASKIEKIEDLLHKPELSDSIQERLKKARSVPDSELLDHNDLKKRLKLT